MNEKGIGGIIMLGVILIVGIILFQATAQNVGGAINTISVANQSETAVYTANFLRQFDITFKNEHDGGVSGGTIKVNGSIYNSPTANFYVDEEDNEITGQAVYHVINGIEYLFDHWSDGGGSNYYHTFTPSTHKTYKAYFNGRPNNSYRNLHFNYG